MNRPTKDAGFLSPAHSEEEYGSAAAPTGDPNRDASATHAKVPAKGKLTKKDAQAIKEVYRYQMSTHLLLRKQPFQEVIEDILENGYPEDITMDKEAARDLQEAAEAYLVDLFKASQDLADFREADNLETKDMRKALELGLPWGHSFNKMKNEEESETEDDGGSEGGDKDEEEEEEDSNASDKENIK
ncbi:hypothetical protein B0H63DRAFT_552379 [Podospora didyma]|uniref:Core Histone H2A/H2B/H3 domain-containing protein n=1 Tax=Podospora didyma TaxID=330526 RepID=A0AAE0K5G3_9PEZI|nr:hypothetical protein B0H63DRAFT_552379 [Podospora didyma]